MRHRHLFARAATRTLASAMMVTGTSFSASKSSRWCSSMVVLTMHSRMHFSPFTPRVADFRDARDDDATRRVSYHGSPSCPSHRLPPPREGGHRCASIGGPPPALSPMCTMMMFSRRYKKTKTKGGKGRKRSSSKEEEEEEENVDADDDDEEEDEEGVEITPFTIASIERETAKAIEHLKLELGKLRTSRASSGIVENIMIESIYDSSAPPVPLKSLGAITVRDAKTISIALYDNSEPNKNAVENAIVNEKHLKFGAKKEASGILVTLPEMDVSARKEVVKMAQDLGEKSKIGVRRARKKALDAVKKQTTRLKIFGEDEGKRFEKAIQKVHDEGIREIDRLEKRKKEQIEKTDEM